MLVGGMEPLAFCEVVDGIGGNIPFFPLFSRYDAMRLRTTPLCCSIFLLLPQSSDHLIYSSHHSSHVGLTVSFF